MADPGQADDWTLTLPADTVLDVDPNRLLPRDCLGVADTSFDFRVGRQIADAEIDHALGDVSSSTPTASHRQRLWRATAAGDETCPWAQLHTTDLPGHPLHRSALALEPMTCPPDAFNSGTGVIKLHPGDRHDATGGSTPSMILSENMSSAGGSPRAPGH